MALVFPNNPATYMAFFEELAKTHKNILHDEDPGRNNFTVISLNALIKGLSDSDFRSWLDKSRSSSKSAQKINENNCQMVLVQMGGAQNADTIKVNHKTIEGSFFILTKPEDNKEASINNAYSVAFNVGDSIMAAIIDFFRKNVLKGKLLQIEDEGVRINNHVGWRWDFAYNAYGVTCYSASNFNNLEINVIS